MNDSEYEKIRQLQSRDFAIAFAIPLAIFGNQLLVTNSINATRRNDELIASLCYMTDKSPQEIKEICEGLPHDLADIKAYYQMWGEFPDEL